MEVDTNKCAMAKGKVTLTQIRFTVGSRECKYASPLLTSIALPLTNMRNSLLKMLISKFAKFLSLYFNGTFLTVKLEWCDLIIFFSFERSNTSIIFDSRRLISILSQACYIYKSFIDKKSSTNMFCTDSPAHLNYFNSRFVHSWNKISCRSSIGNFQRLLNQLFR